MNVVEERQPNCLVILHIEVPVDRVTREWDNIVDEFQKHASIQGYRKGFSPKKLVESRFAKEIREEVQRKLLNSSLEEAIKSKELNVLSILDFENIKLEKNSPLCFSAKVIIAPVFELPEYTGIELEIPVMPPLETRVTELLESIRRKHVVYEPIEDRGLQMGDFAVISFTAQLDGKPLEEVMPSAPKRLCSGKNSWIQMSDTALLPGFSEAILGMRPDETRSFELEVGSENLPTEDLLGKKIQFEVVIEAVNKEVLPELSDEFADKILPGNTLESLKNILLSKQELYDREVLQINKRKAVINYLLSKVKADVPSTYVAAEMRSMIREVIQEHQWKDEKELKSFLQESDISNVAKENAQNRVLSTFVLIKIAEKEDIKVNDEEFSAHIKEMSQRRDVSESKLMKDLARKKNALQLLYEELLVDKALDFIIANANLREPAAVTVPIQALPSEALSLPDSLPSNS